MTSSLYFFIAGVVKASLNVDGKWIDMEWLNNSVRNGAISHQQPASNHRNRKRISSRTFVSQTRYITETISLFGSGVAPPGGLGARAPPPVGRVCPPSGNLKILVGDGWVMIFTKPFNVRDRLDRLIDSRFFLRNRRCAY